MSGMEKGIGCLRSEPEQTLREKILANSKTWRWKPPPPKQYRTNERSLGELRHPQAACHACGRSPGQAVGEAGRLFEEKWKTFSDMQKLKEFINSIPTLQDTSREIFQAEEKAENTI